MGTSVPLPGRCAVRETRWVITGVIIHLHNDLPLLVDLEALPDGGDRIIRCTNVRTVDGKRPSFVHNRHSTFVFPLGVIRLIEAPPADDAALRPVAADDHERPESMDEAVPLSLGSGDEEPDEDLLARIREI